MTRSQIELLVLGATVLVFGVALMLGLVNLYETQKAWRDSEALTRQCEKSLAEILRLRSMTLIADDRVQSASVTNSQIAAVALRCEIAGEQITSIRRSELSPIAGSERMQQRIDVQLRSATLRQMAAFMVAIEQESATMRVSHLAFAQGASLTSELAAGDASPERWNVQLSLTRLVYVAKSNPR